MKQLIILFLILIVIYMCCGKKMREGFVSGEEKLSARYDQLLPLDHPKYVTPQQKDFQIVLSEHSALDPNMQNRRKEIKTQYCKPGDHCFNTLEYHELNYKMKSSPDVLNSKVGFEPNPPPCTRYLRHEQHKVVPSNSTSREMRADLFDDIVLPDLFFERAKTCETK